MLCQESDDIQDEHWRLLLWTSMLKRRTTSERAMAQVRQQNLNAREDLLNQQLAIINQRDVDSVHMLAVTPRVSKPHDYANHMFMRL
jgi:hypothetical protein